MFKLISRSFLFTAIFTSIFLIALGIYFYDVDQKFSDRVYPNVIVNGEDLGGMTREDIEKHYAPKNAALDEVVMEITYDDSIATFSGELIELEYQTKVIADQALLVGRSPRLVSAIAERIRAVFNLVEFNFQHAPSYKLDLIDEYLTELEDVYNIPASNALFEFTDGKVTTFQVEEDGIRLNTDETHEAIKSYLNNQDYLDSPQKKFILSQVTLDPEITIGDINEFGIVEKIGEGRSDFTGSSAEREFNVGHAAARFHGVLIPPGEVFSFNKHVGDISRRTGFKTAYVISQGRTVLGDGGGVCQDSTTMFRAALNTGLPIIERTAHAYRVSYYENDKKPGFDATIYSPTVDLKFLNDTEAYILIQSKIDHEANTLVFEFYGKKDGRTVELSDATVYDYRPAPEPLYEETPELPAGVVKQVDWAASGAKSVFTYKVTMPDGEVTQDREFYSNYRPWRAVYQVGTGGQ